MIRWIVLSCLILVVACQPLADFPTPDGFARVDTDAHAYHAVTPEDAGLKCNIHPLQDQELDFSARQIERRLREDLGYDRVSLRDFSWGTVAGKAFRGEAAAAGTPMTYALWTFMTTRDVYAWEYAGPSEFAAMDIEAVEAAFGKSSP